MERAQPQAIDQQHDQLFAWLLDHIEWLEEGDEADFCDLYVCTYENGDEGYIDCSFPRGNHIDVDIYVPIEHLQARDGVIYNRYSITFGLRAGMITSFVRDVTAQSLVTDEPEWMTNPMPVSRALEVYEYSITQTITAFDKDSITAAIAVAEPLL